MFRGRVRGTGLQRLCFGGRPEARDLGTGNPDGDASGMVDGQRRVRREFRSWHFANGGNRIETFWSRGSTRDTAGFAAYGASRTDWQGAAGNWGRVFRSRSRRS